MPKPNRNVPKTVRSNLLDETFGEWVVIGYAGHNSNRHILWLCQCSCGRTKKVIAGNLRSGLSTMCFHCSYARGGKRKHAPGLTDSAIYRAWRNAMREGACKAWQDLATFVRDTSPKPSRARLTKRDESKPHSRKNSYWRTPQHTVPQQIDELVALAQPATKAGEKRLRKHLADCSRQRRHQLLDKARRGEPIFQRKSLALRFGIETMRPTRK
jgi:hypothetical protein